jgi:alkanesulfonate monooxygenase SsuD/methylene tetrahydromethanopterin reductase-like flavin-dependent oxidoreductase (luciferase family)
LSQRISEGDGIAVIVRVDDPEAARAAEAAGAKALAVGAAIEGLHAASSLPVLWLGKGDPADVDAVAVGPDDDPSDQHETVVVVASEEELEAALDTHDPQIFLLAPRPEDDDADLLELVLDLLPDVPAGKLAIAELDAATRDDVVMLERAGFDAVLVDGGSAADLVGERPPDF